MVHPYLRRRDGLEPEAYQNDEIKAVLERTKGVPIFQEQVIKLTMVAAGFSGGEADELRRAMASWGKNGSLTQFRDRLVEGMLKKGYELDFAERLFRQIQGFGAYGFPESHSASFAILVYLSAWIKLHHPAAFYAGLLNSQPMGFYSPSQLVQDAKRHQVVVLPVCINASDWEHTLDLSYSPPALRLGLRLVKGVSEDSALKLMASRTAQPFAAIADVKDRRILRSDELMKLIRANAFRDFEDNRRRAYWHALQMAEVAEANRPPATEAHPDNATHQSVPVTHTSNADFIRPTTPLEEMLADYRNARGVSLEHHPMQLLRNTLPFQRCITADRLLAQRNNSYVEIAGVVTGRQRPGTASGVLFMTLEDETGNINVVLWKSIQERFRREVLTSQVLYIKGKLEHQHGVVNVIAGYVQDQDHALPKLKAKSRDFH
jgi:error-prone DNA polymerase